MQALIEGERSKNKPPVHVYGVSYGTQLVLRTLQLGPLPACFEQASRRFVAGKSAQDCTL
ncbi:MAG: hypothetical protein WC810_13200 [Janthinobacterium sp.]|jgi:hypothetical protein